uniref:PHD finger protein 5A n=1 Tax=Anser cygnoides TaxID=8845 RepID=A0A8B9ENJ8_ANSCY
MAKHHPDLIFCRKQAGVAIGRLCEKCDGKCVICDSYVRPCTLVRICDECNYGSYQGRCVICGGPGVSDAYYCKECTIQEKDVRCHSASGCIGYVFSLIATLIFKGTSS